MAVFTVRGSSTETTEQYDLSRADVLVAAEDRFKNLTRGGFISAKRTRNGCFLIRVFDPAVDETLFLSDDQLALAAYRASLGTADSASFSVRG